MALRAGGIQAGEEDPEGYREGNGMSLRIQTFLQSIGFWWCQTFHAPRYITRPYKGTYTCLACLRRYEVKW